MSKVESTSKYEYTDITDQMTDSESLEVVNEWSVNFTEINTDTNFTPPSSLAKIFFHTIKYSGGCLYIWIGDQTATLANMACAIQTSYASEPLTTPILGGNNPTQDACAEATNQLACKLAKRLKKQVILAFNVAFSAVSDSDTKDTCLKLIEMALFKEIKLNPHKF